MREKLTRFEDMPVWQESQSFAVEVYKVTKNLPKEELYGLVSQLRRAASSVSANIAEGFGRKTVNDRVHFYHIALGSLLESKNFIYLEGRLDYIEHVVVERLIIQSESIHKQITAIMRYFNNND